ncbi:MAG: chromosome segregation protein SMC [Clostridia bacterium]
MQFKRIEMQGFKSFADPVCIELNDGITCIVGPNGSGKSNISDALRWVLGEQSPKQLRGNKMDEVIFAGTTSRKPKGMAEVSLVVDNSSGMLPVDYNEVAVTRRMYRSGESEYLINGNSCRLKDVRELFMDTGIGVDGYSIIGQGKIQEIVSTKPENRREIFEEAAGIVSYKTRKQDAERKLVSASDNLERVRDIISEIEDRIDGLKEDSEKAQEYIRLRDRYKVLAVNIILHSIGNLERNVESGKTELEELTREYNELLEQKSALDRQVEECRIRDAELSRQYEECNRQLREKTEELNLITNRGQINSERLNNIETNLNRLQEIISDTTTKLDDLKKKRQSMEKDADELEQTEREYRRELQDAVVRLNERTKKTGILRERIEQNRESAMDMGNKNVSWQAEINTLKNYQKTLRDRMEQISSESEGREEHLQQNRARLEEMETAFTEKVEEQENLRRTVESHTEEIHRYEEKIAAASKRLEEILLQVNRRTARRNTIEEMENNYEGYNNAVRAVMQKNLRGVIGTVSELMAVPDGYELAIETALGGAMQNIVCEDDRSAKQAVEWLKSARAGRATFLPIASIHSRPISPGAAEHMDGYLGIAAEMIDFEPAYRDIYGYLLGRVILADNMDCAVAISKRAPGGFRIVTLEGEVISSSGAITGGRYRNKSANLLERKKEIAALDLEIESLHASQKKGKAFREECVQSRDAAKEERKKLTQRLQELEVQLSVLKSEKDHAESLVKESDTATSRYSEELENIQDDLKRAEDMILRYKNQIDEAEKEIQRMEDESEQLSADVERYSSDSEECQEQVVSYKVRLGEQEQKILAMNETIERIIDDITEQEDALNSAEEEYEEQNRQRLLLTTSGAESDEKETALKAEKKALEDREVQLTADLDRNRLDQERGIENQKSISRNVTDMQDRKYKLEIKNAKNETLLSSQKDKLWDEFEMSYAEAMELRSENYAITSGNKEAREIRLRMAELGDVNISAIEEYRNVSRRYEFMTTQESDLTKAMDELQGIIRSMDRTIRERFKDNFERIETNFESTFRELFGGGHAELSLEDEQNPLDSGIDIIAQPPGKSLKNINLMSGGEKTMTAIALMFAVLKTKPTPFCILDEVEAALDEANIERFSDYLKNFHEIQFAIITHQKVTMEHADVLYGVTMPEQGISRMLSLKLEDAREMDLD